MHLIAAAGSLEPPLSAGDIVTVNGIPYQVYSVSEADCLTAELTPAEEAE